jgi:predicted RNA-binding protein YlqC (UPF0109 family)
MSNLRVDKFDDETILRLFGAQAAEDEDTERLKAYFFRNKTYERIKANIPLRLVIGHKGIGKSAVLKIAYLEDVEAGELALWLQPNDIAESWSVEGSFVDQVEGIKKNLLQKIAELSLEKTIIGGKPLDERPVLQNVRQLLNFIAKKIVESPDGLDARVVASFKKSARVKIYIDDIDRGWAATRRDVEKISALINAARDLSNSYEKNLKFCIGIRTDAYNLVRDNDESGDKFEPYTIPIVWSNHDILVIMAMRVSQYFAIEVDGNDLSRKSQAEISAKLFPVIADRFDGAGHWANRPIHNVLLSLTRQRPRDLVKLLSGAATVAEKHGNNRIETTDLVDSFPDYSKGRIADLIAEFKSELPEIQRVLYAMKPTAKEAKEKVKAFLYSNDELIKKLNGIALNQNIYFANGRKASGQSLAEFLFKIDFVIARKDHGNYIERLYYQDHSKLQNSFSEFGFAWEVHPAYRWALNPSSIDDLIKGIEF